jgi:hypothetical protein
MFRGDDEEYWEPAQQIIDRKVEEAMEMPAVGPERQRRRFDTWQEANFVPPSIEELTASIRYAGFRYKDDADVIDKILEIITLCSNFALCDTLRQILRYRAKNHNMVMCLEQLVNLMRAPMSFENRHSQDTYIALIADAAHRLYGSGYQYYLIEAVRATTAGYNKNEPNLSYRPTRHVGILFPQEDFFRERGETNSKVLKKLLDDVSNIESNGGIDFKAVQDAFQGCQDLLYHNHWQAPRPQDWDYVKDVEMLIVYQAHKDDPSSFANIAKGGRIRAIIEQNKANARHTGDKGKGKKNYNAKPTPRMMPTLTHPLPFRPKASTFQTRLYAH